MTAPEVADKPEVDTDTSCNRSRELSLRHDTAVDRDIRARDE
jgi:hypothetical protein